MSYEYLLSPGRIGALETRNRIVMSPMGSNLAEPDGSMGERISAYYEARASGGAGLLIVGVGAIAHPIGACNPNQVAISDDLFLPGLEGFTARVHAHGARVAIQLQHAGKVATQDIAAGRPMWVPSTPALGPFDLYDDLTREERGEATASFRRPGANASFHEMTHDDIAWLVERFAEAGLRARRAGFDGVEVHAAHGYIVAEFLSAAANRRTDEYGGAIEDRARLLCEIISAIKDRAGRDFPVWCRLDGREFRIEGGITPDDARRTAELAVAAGADAAHVSAYADSSVGAAFTEAPLVDTPAGLVELAAAVKAGVAVPVIAVGRIEPELAESIIAEGKADFVAMGRKLLADPDLPAKLASGRSSEIRPCIYGYTCVGRIFLNRQNRCAVNPLTGREHETPMAPAVHRRRVVVVGGGPGGMEVARIAAVRGHEVTLAEASENLGGTLAASAALHEPNGELVRYLVGAVERAGVDIHLGQQASPAWIQEVGADVVVAATGAEYAAAGAELQAATASPLVWPQGGPVVIGAFEAAELLAREDLPWSRAVVLGGGLEGLAIADRLSRAGGEVAVSEPGGTFGVGMAPPRRWRVLAALRERGVTLVTGGTPLAELEAARDAEIVIMCTTPTPRSGLVTELSAMGREVHAVGECGGARYVEAVMRNATEVALNL